MAIINESLLQNAFPFWEELSGAQRRLLLDNAVNLAYEAGQYVLNAENDCLGVLIVESGELRVYLLPEDGREITLYRIFPGDVCILSAGCMLRNITFDVFIDAERKSEVCLVAAPIFDRLQKENIHVENFALRLAAERFSDVMWTMEQMLFRRFDRRLAAFLYDETLKNKSPSLALTHGQIAKYMGSAREVVSRMMKKFEDDGILRIHRGGVELINRERLKKLL
ncbi:MAG: Crp/Fnr family transcriptional regulator [Treponema sp.]|nr:Crp/Fnr family transcriptional regulator [Treponema sp.]